MELDYKKNQILQVRYKGNITIEKETVNLIQNNLKNLFGFKKLI